MEGWVELGKQAGESRVQRVRCGRAFVALLFVKDNKTQPMLQKGSCSSSDALRKDAKAERRVSWDHQNQQTWVKNCSPAFQLETSQYPQSLEDQEDKGSLQYSNPVDGMLVSEPNTAEQGTEQGLDYVHLAFSVTPLVGNISVSRTVSRSTDSELVDLSLLLDCLIETIPSKSIWLLITQRQKRNTPRDMMEIPITRLI